VLQHAFLLSDGSVVLYGETRGLLRDTDQWVVQITPEQMASAVRGDDAPARLAVAWRRWQVAAQPIDPVALPAPGALPDAEPSAEDVEACSSFIGAMRRVARPLPVLDEGAPDVPGEPVVARLRPKIVPEGDRPGSAPAQVLLRRIPMAGAENEAQQDLAVGFLAGNVEAAPGYLALVPLALAYDTTLTGVALAFSPIVLIHLAYLAIADDAEDPREALIRAEARAAGCRCVATFSPRPFDAVRECYRPVWWTAAGLLQPGSPPRSGSASRSVAARELESGARICPSSTRSDLRRSVVRSVGMCRGELIVPQRTSREIATAPSNACWTAPTPRIAPASHATSARGRT
jgi:hypothetical protein